MSFDTCHAHDGRTEDKNMFEEITSIKNIELAYLELAQNFDEKCQGSKYVGIDGLKFNQTDPVSKTLIQIVARELTDYQPIAPAYTVSIPKKNGSFRDVYIYTIKDRLKAQAIYRVIKPRFEKNFSRFLFSYRSSHPSYYAARSVVKRYLNHFGRDFILIGDLTDYSNYIDRQILEKKINRLNLDHKATRLLKLFLENKIYRTGQIYQPPTGVIQGVPLIALFANLYLNDFDHEVGSQVALYRRVGDDLIFFDHQQNKIEKIYDRLREVAAELKVKIKTEKTKLINSTENFNFLGYNFNNRVISLEPGTIRQNIIEWRRQLNLYPGKNQTRKLSHFKKSILYTENSIRNQFDQLVQQKILVNNQKQIKKLSEAFIRLVVKYFFGSYTPRQRRLTQKLIKPIQFNSLYKNYLDVHHGRRKITSHAVSRTESD